MGKIIVLDIRGDRQGMGMQRMLADGAFPDKLAEAIKHIMGDVYPFEEQEGDSDLCPGIGFPVQKPIHAVLNHLYATAQKPNVPEEALATVKDEAENVMDVDGDFDDEMKSMVLQGSKKVYNRILEDGTEINVEVTSPTEKKAMSDPIAALKRLTSKRKSASIKDRNDSFGLDVDKLFKVAGYLHIADSSFKEDMNKLAKKTAESGRIVFSAKECADNALLNKCVKKIAELSGETTDKVVEKSKSDADSQFKDMFNGQVTDKRKFTKKPFDSFDSAVKALGKQVAELICDKTSGNIVQSKLKDLEEYADEDSLMSKLADRVAHTLKWAD